MSNELVSILGIYLFIAVGYLAKAVFKEKLDEKTLVLLSVYFLQIFLTFWGLLKRPIDIEFIQTPLIYLVIILAVLVLNLFIVRALFDEPKERSIATVAALIGNTGNLGIPLGIALFGESSIAYTTIINLVNVFFVYTFGVYFYARGSFSVKKSVLSIVKIPIIWAAIVAIGLNMKGYTPSLHVELILQMGAYASMVLQLVIFGMYLYGIEILSLSKKLLGYTLSLKFVLIPLAAFIFLSYIEIDTTIKAILFMELFMPLAVTNVNLASLYECKVQETTAIVFVSSLLFLAFIFIYLDIIKFIQ